ncbi:MAG: signal recognition particle receptor subunit alpha [Candidatus Thermoplasmatota archaeon]|nr:signal recognition particle receptor subunit alpha [Candidatus Thermoplasmatota archaeon]
MVLDSLAKSLRDALKRINRSALVDDRLVEEIVKEMQRALLMADVDVGLTLEMTNNVERRAKEEPVPKNSNPRNHLIKIIYEELLRILGKPREFHVKPATLMLVGLYGQGKTTSAGKLAKFYLKHGYKVVLIAADTQRLGAYEQLEQVSSSVGASFFGIYGEKDSRKVVKQALEKYNEWDVKIIDTSGRNAIDASLTKEISDINEFVKPDEVVLVLDASIGQQAGKQAKAFNDSVKITGVFISKLDGTAKGGGALSAVASTGAPILFMGTGEHMEDMEYFNPARFLSRLLGMGDFETLMAAAKEFQKEIDESAMEKMAGGKFTLKEMYDIWDQMNKPGLFKKLFESMPMAAGGMKKDMDDQFFNDSEDKLKRYKVIMDSMTYYEMENPDEIKGSRVERIAEGSGYTTADVKELLKDYKRVKDMVKNIRGNRKILSMMKKQFKSGGLPEDFGNMPQ